MLKIKSTYLKKGLNFFYRIYKPYIVKPIIETKLVYDTEIVRQSLDPTIVTNNPYVGYYKPLCRFTNIPYVGLLILWIHITCLLLKIKTQGVSNQ